MKIPEISGKITSFITVTALTAGLILTVIGKKSDFSINENRKLASFPEFSVSALTDGSYGKQLNKYITDHFFMREKWVSAQACIESCMGEKIINGVYIDSKGLLDAEISSRCISEKNINAVNKFFADYTGTVYFTAVPTASGIYGDKLPEYLMTNPEKNQIDFLYDNLTDGIRTIDTYNILRMLNDNYIYYRNDTRLTSYGAYYVYRTIIQKLGFKPSSYDKYTIKHITSDFRGNLYNRCLYNGT
ncbi:MAG: DHHW family protein, partial [Muribaculaceae bacterium]|nr:DHHW family protein [Muribaculaceae bacterium]